MGGEVGTSQDDLDLRALEDFWDGNDEGVRQGLFGVAEANPEVLIRPRRPEGDWEVIYNRHFLDERLYGPDVTEAERTEVIRARWAEFLNDDLPRIDAALKEERWIWESADPGGLGTGVGP